MGAPAARATHAGVRKGVGVSVLDAELAKQVAVGGQEGGRRQSCTLDSYLP